MAWTRGSVWRGRGGLCGVDAGVCVAWTRGSVWHGRGGLCGVDAGVCVAWTRGSVWRGRGGLCGVDAGDVEFNNYVCSPNAKKRIAYGLEAYKKCSTT